MSDALTPNSIPEFIKQEPPVSEETITDDEKALAVGSRTKFWTTLRKHFDESITELEQINDQAIESGMTLEEIGRNALVISQVKGVLRKIVNVVEDSREAQDGGQGK